MSGTKKTTRGRRRSSEGSRLRLPLLIGVVTVAVFCLLLLPDLLKPEQAQAGGIPGVPDFMDPAAFAEDALKKAGSTATGAIQDGFFWMLNQLFGGVQAALSVELLVWLTRLPDFSHGQVGAMEKTVQVAAGAFLGCILTLSVVRFWLGSYSSGGGVMAGLEGVFRTAFAALMIGLWPWLFGLGVKTSNAFSSAMLHDGVRERLENLFQGLDMASLGLPATAGAAGGAIGVAIGSGISLLMWIVIAFASVTLFLGLIVMKIMLTAGTVLVFVVMPLALVLWPLPETSWIANALAKTCAVLLAIPVLWILTFAAASAIGADVFFLSNNGTNENFLQTGLNILLVKPLVACALLYMAIVLPTRLLRMAPITGNMGRPGQVMGSVKTLATYAGFKKVSSMAGGAATGAGQAGGAAGAAGGAGPQKPQFVPNQTRDSSSGAGSGSRAARAGAENAAAAAGASMGTAAGGAGGPVGAAAGGAIGGAAGAGAMRQLGSGAGAAAGAGAAVSKFEEAPSSFVDKKTGGPMAMSPSQEYASKVKADHSQMRSMPDSQRPSPAKVQAAWNTLDSSPSAQSAISRVSADPVNAGQTAPELAAWSNDGGNPFWGNEAQQATRTIGEAAPDVRENVVTAGKGYPGGSTGGSGGGGNGGGGGGGGNGGGGATPRPKVDKAAPSASNEHKRPPVRQVGANQ